MKKGMKMLIAASLGIVAVAPTAVTTASAAEAPLQDGIYVGGSVNKFYTVSEFVGFSAANQVAILSSASLDNIKYVFNGKVASLTAMSANGLNALQTYKSGDLNASYTGTNGTVTPPATPANGELSVESVRAITKTKVEVKFSQAVDAVKAENFTIAGTSVTAASLSADKKTATLEVSGLDYAKSYTVAVKNVLVNGKEVNVASKSFTTPALVELWDLQVTSKDGQLTANGADNTVVTFKLVNKVTGQVDTKADDMVLALSTTHGSLAKSRATIENGVATVILTSEFSNKELTAKIDAQIIEASGDYKDLIGKVIGTKTVKFAPKDVTPAQTISVVGAESNQADRITLFFDKEVSLNTFITKDDKGNLLYLLANGETKTADKIEKDDVVVSPAFLSSWIGIYQDRYIYDEKDIRGIRPVAGNPKAIEVILDKDNTLTDNKTVYVDVAIKNPLGSITYTNTEFKLTDARDPEVTSVTAEDASTLKVKFSEAMYDATFKIDGQYDESTFNYEFGDFNPVTLEDYRDVATIKLTDDYDEDRIADTDPANKTIAGYFSNGSHSLQVSSAKDFAYLTDRNNEGTTQNLTFNVGNTAEKPGATVKVESPEQFRLAFDKKLKEQNPAEILRTLADVTDEAKTQLKFEVYNEKTKKYENVIGNTKFGGLTAGTKLSDLLNITQVPGTSEFVFELTEDWTRLYNTNVSKENYYNDKFRIVIEEGAVTNKTNGAKNDEIVLDLNYSGSALNAPDTKSAAISKIEETTTKGQFIVTMDEPVKLYKELNGNPSSEDNAGDTLNQSQSSLPVTSVQFIGKDKDGKTRTFDGIVGGYADTNNGADTKFYVEWKDVAETPQTIVNKGGSEDWTVVVKSLSDDVGNTVATATKDFKLTKEVLPSPFEIEKFGLGYDWLNQNDYYYNVIGETNGNDKDKLTITFTEGVQFNGGEYDATSTSQFMLNGSTLPVGTSIAVKDADDNRENGLETVIITLPDKTLLDYPSASNIITVNKNLVSHDGTVLTGDYEVNFFVCDIFSLDLAKNGPTK